MTTDPGLQPPCPEVGLGWHVGGVITRYELETIASRSDFHPGYSTWEVVLYHVLFHCAYYGVVATGEFSCGPPPDGEGRKFAWVLDLGPMYSKERWLRARDELRG